MSKRALVVIAGMAAILIGLMVIFANHLPAELRAQIEAGQNRIASTRQKLASARTSVAKDAAASPELFRVRAFDREWPGRFNEAQAALGEADRYAAQLEELRRKNSKSSRPQVEDLLRRERERVDVAASRTDAVLAESRKRADLKRDFPKTLKQVQSRAKVLADADYSSIVPKVEKAEADWPSKKDDLQSRLGALLAPQEKARDWEQAAGTLQVKPDSALTVEDYAQALDLEESVDAAPGQVQARELAGLSDQLYTSWDNILQDLDKDHDRYRERLKHVVTTVPAPGAGGSTRSEDYWRDVPPEQWRALENNIGMTVAHKPLGEYDSAANTTPQPAGFAYMASPAEGRNQYGYWDHRDGASVWMWLPQYLILRDLLSNRSYQPIPSYDWDRYRQAQRSGTTYYGREVSGAPKYGSHGTFTLKRYGNSRYVQTGGFSGSKYASGGSGGGFSGSRYGSGGRSPSASSSSSSGRRYGSPSASGAPRRYGNSSGGMRFGSGSRSAGRSFGGRRR